MNKTGFFALTAVTAALIVGAVVFQPAATTVNTTEGDRFFPGLDAKTVNAVDRIQVTAKGETFTLERKNGTWVAKEKGGYPIRFAKVKEALFSLAGAVVFAMIVYTTIPYLLFAWTSGQYFGGVAGFFVPVWPVKAVTILGSSAIAVQFLLRAWRHVRLARGGDRT